MTPIARAMRTAPSMRVEPAPESQRAIPFDYTFRFDLEGKQDLVHRSVVTVSIEAVFTAVSIGYGVVPRVTPIVFGPVTITVNPPTLPAGVVNNPYNQTITQTGGVTPVTFSSSGALPNGMNLSPQGVLSGTPIESGFFQFTVRATDAEGSFGERAYLLEIARDIVINPPTLPVGAANELYTETTITQTGGVTPVTFSLSAGPLPNGMTLSSQGVLSGTPTESGSFKITVRATDAEGSFGERAYQLEITGIIITLARRAGSSPRSQTSQTSQSLRDISISNLFNGLRRALADTPDPIKGETGPEAAFKGGIRLNPQFAELALLDDGQNVVSDVGALQRLFQVVSAPSDEIQFLYAIFDDGSGREFQSEPLLNTAGLGSSDGARPFRYFARPITFAPRSVIRMEVTEKSDFQGELHVSLHGYKVLGSPGTPTGRTQSARSRARR